MGIEKLAVEFVEEMTEPSGWPDIDETDLQSRATEFIQLRDRVNGVVGDWRAKQNQIFEGGVWSGGGADAGRSSLQQRMDEMSSLEQHLGKAHAYYNMLGQLVMDAKALVNQNLQNAQQIIQAIRNAPDLDEGEKRASSRAMSSLRTP